MNVSELVSTDFPKPVVNAVYVNAETGECRVPVKLFGDSQVFNVRYRRVDLPYPLTKECNRGEWRKWVGRAVAIDQRQTLNSLGISQEQKDRIAAMVGDRFAADPQPIAEDSHPSGSPDEPPAHPVVQPGKSPNHPDLIAAFKQTASSGSARQSRKRKDPVEGSAA